MFSFCAFYLPRHKLNDGANNLKEKNVRCSNNHHKFDNPR